MNIWIAALDAHGNGGITTHINALTRQIIEMGHKVEWITPNGEITENLSNIVINTNQQLFNRYPNNLSVDIIETWAVRLEMNFRLKLSESMPDIIHCHDVISYQQIKVLAEQNNVPIILTIHGHIPDEEVNHGHIEEKSVEYKYWRKCEWFALKEVDTVISVGEELAKYLKNIHDQANIVHIPNFLHDSFSEIALQDVRIQLGIGEEQILLFCPSRFEFIKGIEFLLDAMLLLPDNYSLLLIDNGKTKLQENIDNRNLQNRIKVIQPVSNQLMSSLYAASDLCVIPSIKKGTHTETSSFTAIESFSMGTPVIASEVGGLKEVVGQWGKLVPMQNSQTLAEGILDILESNEKTDQYRTLAIQRSEAFAARNVVPKLISHYKASITNYQKKHVTPFILYGFSAKVLKMIFLTILNDIDQIEEILDFAKVRFGVSYRQNLLESYSIIINLLRDQYPDLYQAGTNMKPVLQEYISSR